MLLCTDGSDKGVCTGQQEPRGLLCAGSECDLRPSPTLPQRLGAPQSREEKLPTYSWSSTSFVIRSVKKSDAWPACPWLLCSPPRGSGRPGRGSCVCLSHPCPQRPLHLSLLSACGRVLTHSVFPVLLGGRCHCCPRLAEEESDPEAYRSWLQPDGQPGKSHPLKIPFFKETKHNYGKFKGLGFK